MPRPLSPLNPFVRIVGPIMDIDPVTSLETPVIAGTVIGFLSTSKEPTAAAADGALQTNLVYVGAQPGRKVGQWMFRLGGAVLTPALLEQHFATARPFLVVERTGVARVFEELQYSRPRAATLVP